MNYISWKYLEKLLRLGLCWFLPFPPVVLRCKVWFVNMPKVLSCRWALWWGFYPSALTGKGFVEAKKPSLQTDALGLSQSPAGRLKYDVAWGCPPSCSLAVLLHSILWSWLLAEVGDRTLQKFWVSAGSLYFVFCGNLSCSQGKWTWTVFEMTSGFNSGFTHHTLQLPYQDYFSSSQPWNQSPLPPPGGSHHPLWAQSETGKRWHLPGALLVWGTLDLTYVTSRGAFPKP